MRENILEYLLLITSCTPMKQTWFDMCSCSAAQVFFTFLSFILLFLTISDLQTACDDVWPVCCREILCCVGRGFESYWFSAPHEHFHSCFHYLIDEKICNYSAGLISNLFRVLPYINNNDRFCCFATFYGLSLWCLPIQCLKKEYWWFCRKIIVFIKMIII